MDLTSPTTTATKTLETESETPPPIQLTKPIINHHHNPTPLSFTTNGVLKRHHHKHRHSAPSPVVISYKECLRNHAASLGGHALDGCCEFIPSPSSIPTDPTSLKCGACGCHRNFHRRESDEVTHISDFHLRSSPPPPSGGRRSPNSLSPPPLSSSYYPSAPHMLLALSKPAANANTNAVTPATPNTGNPDGRKRFRTKFSHEQKEKMHLFAEKVGWKMVKSNEEMVEDFCNGIGVGKGVLKVWMHNNKNSFRKRDANGGEINTENHDQSHYNNSSGHVDVATYGSSSSS